jgi:hypothetical protein
LGIRPIVDARPAWNHDTMMSVGVNSWWACLCTVAAFNVVAWCWSASLLVRRKETLHQEAYTIRRLQLLLSAVYVFGCAFRSFLPVYDIPRLTLAHSWLANAFVGRSVATCAELSFVAQWAVMLHQTHRATGSRIARWSALCVLPLIVVAEMCSWYSVLTTANIGHVVEESLWGVSAALLVISIVSILPRCELHWRPVLYLAGATVLAYVVYMFTVDVPMYWTRWLSDQAHNRHYLTLMQGVLDAAERHVVSHRWSDWKSEVTWMSLYFSIAVWISIALVHAPVPTLQTQNKRVAPRMTPMRRAVVGQTVSRRRT